MENLWPTNIGIEVDSAPVAIMRKQAELLGDRTKNLVTADVTIGSTYKNDKFVYYFYIVAPTLNNYHFRLFTIEHGVEMYPLTIYVDEVLGKELDAEPKMLKTIVSTNAMERLGRAAMGIEEKIEERPVPYFIALPTEEEFIRGLKDILSSQRTRQVIGSLLSQVNANNGQYLEKAKA